MSTQIKRVEKEYFLSKLIGEQIPVVYMFNRQDYVLKIDKITKNEIEFITAKPVEGLVVNKKINLMFDYKGLIISFSAEVKEIREAVITMAMPDVLYKNLARSNQRVVLPADLQIELISLEDRYSLPFPKSSSFESLDSTAVLPNVEPKDFNAIVTQVAQEIKLYADGYKIIYYNTDVQPEKMEERVVAENGKILLIFSTNEKFPQFTAEKKFITSEIFKRYLESIGIGVTFLDQSIEQFIKAKMDEGIQSAIWVPFLFQEYVVGYIYAWKTNKTTNAKKPFNEEMAEKLYRYGKCIVFSLEKRGYFEAGRTMNRAINGKVVDISASGLRFAVPNSFVFITLQQGVEIAIRLKSSTRTINAKLKVRRRYKEANVVYLGCSFLDMTPEDAQYLFEFIYGTPTLPGAIKLITGNV
jgi:c-di-GMP-binding flagellar brake protein YcgR